MGTVFSPKKHEFRKGDLDNSINDFYCVLCIRQQVLTDVFLFSPLNVLIQKRQKVVMKNIQWSWYWTPIILAQIFHSTNC